MGRCLPSGRSRSGAGKPQRRLAGPQPVTVVHGTRTREAEQDENWTVRYEGSACYDRVSGVLVTLEYTKRWLFTGTFEGKTYDHEYLGDYEVYQQIITEANVPLSNK